MKALVSAFNQEMIVKTLSLVLIIIVELSSLSHPRVDQVDRGAIIVRGEIIM